nr:PH domain-containing protein [Kribbella shirazensis]
MAIAALLGLGLTLGWLYGVLAVVLIALGFGWSWVLIGRNQRSWKYAEREDELLVSHGILFRELVVVPYGRMQFVDVTAGPLERACGLATVELHTATPATDAKIPGLHPDEAGRLRDRLSALGQAQAWGL